MKLFSIIFLTIVFAQSASGQIDPRVAHEYFKKNNFNKALVEYKNLMKVERDNPDYNLRAAICILKTNGKKSKAVYYLERAKAQSKYDKEVNYYLGVAYAIDFQFDKAIKVLVEYIDKPGNFLVEATKRKADCEFAKTKVKNPIPISFQNMGKSINSKYPDYYPFVSGDEEVLTFTSRRGEGKSQMDIDGYYTSDVYYSKFDGTRFSKSKMATSINTKFNDQSTGITSSSDTMLFYSDYKPGGALYFVPKKGTKFGKRKEFILIQEEKFLESAFCISPDGNTIVYSTNKEGGLGGLDLWMIRKLPFGDNAWALPQNIPSINTSFNEDFPSFSADGKTIYFSSQGHPGMGGWDVYSTEWDAENNTFTPPKNIGYPVNTPDDERSISYARDGKHAYISTYRKDGLGDLDIYRITFEEVEITPALFSIKLATNDTINPFVAADVVTILDDTDEIVGEYMPNTTTLEYTIILPPGEYRIEIDAESAGYEYYSGEFKVHEFMNRMGQIKKIYTLKKSTE